MNINQLQEGITNALAAGATGDTVVKMKVEDNASPANILVTMTFVKQDVQVEPAVAPDADILVLKAY